MIPDLFTLDKETAWQMVVDKAERRKTTPCTKSMALQYLVDRIEDVWVASYEFDGKRLNDGRLLSHRACARASDLAIYHPELVECRKVKRIAYYRLRTENLSQVIKFIRDNK